MIDSGMIHTLGFASSPNLGAIYENLVFLELMRRRELHQFDLYYWQDAMKREVDFVKKEGTKVIELIQVCYDANRHNVKEREVTSLLKASAECKCNALTIITKDYEMEDNSNGKKISYVPLWKWLLE